MNNFSFFSNPHEPVDEITGAGGIKIVGFERLKIVGGATKGDCFSGAWPLMGDRSQ